MCGVKIVIVTDFACVCVRCVGFYSNSFFLSWFFITTTTSFLCFRKRGGRVAWEDVEESSGSESRTAAAEAAAKAAAKGAEAKAKASSK